MSEAAPKVDPAPAADSAEPENDVRLSFYEHLKELRKRLIWALVGVAVGTAAVGYFAERLFRWLMAPVIASLPKEARALNYTSYVEPFIVYLKVALYGGLFVAAPVVLWQIWLFIAPGLYKREKRVVIPFLACGTTLFYAGAAFCYFLVMPYAFPAMASIAGEDMKPILTMSEQLTLVLAMMLGFGLVFELPVILGFLAKVGVVSADFLAKFRRHAIIINVVIAAIITPTSDPLNLALMALPMVIFYEIGVLLARILGKKKEKEEEAPASE